MAEQLTDADIKFIPYTARICDRATPIHINGVLECVHPDSTVRMLRIELGEFFTVAEEADYFQCADAFIEPLLQAYNEANQQ
jgi:hypothetical protein